MNRTWIIMIGLLATLAVLAWMWRKAGKLISDNMDLPGSKDD
jgi:hypothetical protein